MQQRFISFTVRRPIRYWKEIHTSLQIRFRGSDLRSLMKSQRRSAFIQTRISVSGVVIFYTLQQSVAEGHVYLTKDVLLRRASALLEVEIKDIEKYLMDLSMEKKIVLKESEEGLRVYVSHFYYLELNTAKMLHDLNLEYEEANVVIGKKDPSDCKKKPKCSLMRSRKMRSWRLCGMEL